MRILLVEDNPAILKGLTYSLQKEYEVISKTKVLDVINYIKQDNKFNLIILDVTLPDGNGFDLYKNYIKELNIPCIFLTALDSDEDIISGLDMGAEDYITKPFSTNVLLARINKILKKKENIIKIDNIKYDLDKMILYKDNNVIDLSSLELKIINLLFLNTNKVVSRSQLLDSIWQWTGNDVDDHTITVYLKRIKDKIGKDIIKTIKGIGYRIDE